MRTWVLLIAALLLQPATAGASPSSMPSQSQSGAIAGIVKDAAGAVLAGVPVEASSPALIEKTRTTVTDMRAHTDHRASAWHLYRHVHVAGFNTVMREGIEFPARSRRRSR